MLVPLRGGHFCLREGNAIAVTYGKTYINSDTGNSASSSVTAINASGRPPLVRALIEKLDHMGYDLANQFGKGGSIANPLLKWTNKVYNALTVTTDTAGYTDTVTTINVASGHGNRIPTYAVLRNGAELLWVTAVSTDALTVVRGIGATSGVAIPAAATTLQRVGIAVPENVKSPAGVYARGEFYQNSIQQFIYAVQTSDIQANTDTSWLVEGNPHTTSLKDQLKEARRDFERTLFYGVESAGATTAASFMSGFPVYITQHATALAGDIMEEADFLELAQSMWSDVGPENMGRTVISGIFLKQVVSSWADNMRRLDATTTKVTAKVDAIENDMGLFEFTPNFHCPETDLFIINPKNYVIHPYKGLDWQMEKLSKDGAYERDHVKGVFTLEAPGDRASGKITGAGVLRASYPSMVTA